MSMIFIAKDYKNRIIGIVGAKSEEAARAYYQGQDLHYNTLTSIDPTVIPDNEAMGYCTPILKTRRLEGYMLKDKGDIIIIE